MDRRSSSPSSRSSRLLAALVLIGLVLRVPRLLESLWYDEIAAWRIFGFGSAGLSRILTTWDDPANHLLHTALTWASMRWLGGLLGPELALRTPALLFSLGTIVVVHALARRAAGARVAALAALIAAAAPVAVLEGAEARGYSMMIFFAAAATWAMTAILESRRRGMWLGYGALCALGAWSHMMSVFVPAGHASWLAWRSRHPGDRRAVWRGAGGIATAGALTLLLYAPVLGDILDARGLMNQDGSGGTRGPGLLGPEGLAAVLQLGGSWSWWAALPGLVLLGLGLARASASARPRALTALLLLGLPLFAAAVLMGGTWMYARFALFSLPGAFVLMALGIDALWQRRAGLGVAALVVLLGAFLLDLGTRPPKQPLRDAAAFVADRTTPGERVLVAGLWHNVLDVYSRGLEIEHSRYHGADLPERLDAAAPGWIIVIYPDSVPADRFELLRRHGYAPIETFPGWVDRGNGEVQVWSR